MPSLQAGFAESFIVLSTKAIAINTYRLRSANYPRPALIWAHANGFNAGCYQPFLNMLGGHFDVFAFDARGHGASAKPLNNLESDYAMVRFAEDLRAVTDRVREMIGMERPIHLAAHSLGGLAAILLEAEFGEAPFESLTLFEPPIYPPIGHAERAAALAHSPIFVRWAATRKNVFQNEEVLRKEIETIVTYRRFAPEMMVAYLAAAVAPVIGGGLILRCPSIVESSIYGNCPDSGIFEKTSKVKTPTCIYATDQNVLPDFHSWAPETMASIANNMPNAEARTMIGCLHLMVQENPKACAAGIIKHALRA